MTVNVICSVPEMNVVGMIVTLCSGSAAGSMAATIRG